MCLATGLRECGAMASCAGQPRSTADGEQPRSTAPAEQPRSTAPTEQPRWPAYAVATWMVAFASVHAIWALGGRIGLPDGFRVPDRPLPMAIDLLAIVLCIAGSGIALASVQPWGSQIPRRTLSASLGAAAALAFVHSAPTIADDSLAALGLLDLNLHSESDRLTQFVIEPFWMTGAVLCALAAIAAQTGAAAQDHATTQVGSRSHGGSRSEGRAANPPGRPPARRTARTAGTAGTAGTARTARTARTAAVRGQRARCRAHGYPPRPPADPADLEPGARC